MRADSRCEIQEDGMNQKVEIERMQAAFNRAAEKATRGTREERSGRFELRDNARLTRGDTQTAEPRRGSKLEKRLACQEAASAREIPAWSRTGWRR
jgi:hypothetical protein